MIEGNCAHWERDTDKPGNHPRGYLEVHPEGLMVRVEDDAYDGEFSKEEACRLARLILATYEPA